MRFPIGIINRKNRYTHGPEIDEPLSVSTDGGTYYYHADGLGSIIALTDADQKVVQEYEYDAFGNLHDQKHAVKQPYTITGREWDKETKLYYYRARYYDAKVGRFVSKDPFPGILADSQTLNGYPYVGNNPVNFIDPLGLWRNPWDIYDEASRDAQSRFSRNELWNGSGDAYRHYLASCMMTHENGMLSAWLFGEANEIHGDLFHNQERGERCMDENNNAAGSGFGESANSTADCQNSCMNATTNGTLETYTSGTTSGYMY